MEKNLIDYTLYLADNALILGHRNSEWCAHGPVLEQDIAITNISLDLIGQARNFYQYAARIKNDGSTEDTFACLRDVNDFKNCLLVEQPNGDWAQTILRQFFFSAYQYFLYQQLELSKDEKLAAIAVKSLKEVTYHLRWSSEWVIRLGDGTEESHQRMLNAIQELWSYTDELFEATDYESSVDVEDIFAGLFRIKDNWKEKVDAIFNEATLPVPQKFLMHSGGKAGRHSQHMTNILADLQFLQRTYPGCEW
ncbi:MAG: phenylacetate-CoA oxygenase subunit PaaC [Bacteroidia bacterium]|nr:phenylacetate-CoA oxygenase subunit PaaC [Bacteroidia bacterium]